MIPTTTTSSNTTAAHRSIVALKLPTKVPALIGLATGIVQGLTGNVR
jgi:hypothetical protein